MNDIPMTFVLLGKQRMRVERGEEAREGESGGRERKKKRKRKRGRKSIESNESKVYPLEKLGRRGGNVPIGISECLSVHSTLSPFSLSLLSFSSL